MVDQPIAYTAEGRPLFDNTPTVVCVIVENNKGQVLTVRRANEPGKGLLGLPGGYHMRGETWQEAGIREVKEETDVSISTDQILLLSMDTDEYGNNLVIAMNCGVVDQTGSPVDGEARELVWLEPRDMSPKDWAFPRHYEVVEDYFENHHQIHTTIFASAFEG